MVGLCDNGKTYTYLDDADNVLQNYLDNDSYRDIMIGYYAYILDFCNSKIALCTNVFVCFMWYTIVSGNLLLSR